MPGEMEQLVYYSRVFSVAGDVKVGKGMKKRQTDGLRVNEGKCKRDINE